MLPKLSRRRIPRNRTNLSCGGLTKSLTGTLYAGVMDAVQSLAEAVGAIRIAYPEVDPQSEVVPLALMTVDPILDAAGPNLRIGC